MSLNSKRSLYQGNVNDDQLNYLEEDKKLMRTFLKNMREYLQEFNQKEILPEKLRVFSRLKEYLGAQKTDDLIFSLMELQVKGL